MGETGGDVQYVTPDTERISVDSNTFTAETAAEVKTDPNKQKQLAQKLAENPEAI